MPNTTSLNTRPLCFPLSLLTLRRVNPPLERPCTVAQCTTNRPELVHVRLQLALKRRHRSYANRPVSVVGLKCDLRAPVLELDQVRLELPHLSWKTLFWFLRRPDQWPFIGRNLGELPHVLLKRVNPPRLRPNDVPELLALGQRLLVKPVALERRLFLRRRLTRELPSLELALDHLRPL